MKHAYFTKSACNLIPFLIFIIGSITIQSCRKDKEINVLSLTDSVNKAKVWYESTYPVNTAAISSNTAIQNVTASNTPFDYSQHIHPDWDHNTSYARLKKGVIEVPLKSTDKILSTLKNNTTGKLIYAKENSKTSLIILNDGKTYQAFIMTILADDSYLNGDRTKLNKNTYRKRDANFTGMVVYFTPKGKFVSAFAYQNGTLEKPTVSKTALQSLRTTNSPCDLNDNLKTKSANSTKQLDEAFDCTDWYLDTYLNGELISEEYMYTTCVCADGGNGGGATPPPNPCTPPGTDPGDGGIGNQNSNSLKRTAVNDDGDGDDNGDGDDGGFVDPSDSDCNTGLQDVDLNSEEENYTDDDLSVQMSPEGAVISSPVYKKLDLEFRVDVTFGEETRLATSVAMHDGIVRPGNDVYFSPDGSTVTRNATLLTTYRSWESGGPGLVYVTYEYMLVVRWTYSSGKIVPSKAYEERFTAPVTF